MGKNIFNKIPDAEKTIKKELLSSFCLNGTPTEKRFQPDCHKPAAIL